MEELNALKKIIEGNNELYLDEIVDELFDGGVTIATPQAVFRALRGLDFSRKKV
jgi:rRNA-processing protein FCF1